MYPLMQPNANTEAFEGWCHEISVTWFEAYSELSQQALQNIIDLYLLTRRPGCDPIIVTNTPANSDEPDASPAL